MRQDIEEDVKEVVSNVAKLTIDEIDAESHLQNDLGVTSLDLVLLREAIERRFGIFIGDDELDLFVTVASIVDVIGTKRGDIAKPAGAGTDPKRSLSPHLTTGSYLTRDLLYSDLEIGMPLTGRNNLAETPLLREIGHLRWQHISALSDVASRDVVDDDGERLYPTFFYVEVAFPPARPMATFGENDRFTVVSTLRRYGRSMLDGEHFLFPSHDDDEKKRPPPSLDEALRAGIPYLRLSNAFVKQWEGAGWLKKSRPAAPGFERIPEMAEPPESYADVTRVKEQGAFFDIPESYVSLTEGPVRVQYAIVPDRDLNGAGLLYFANYPMILDIAEREVLHQAALEDDLIDRRTLVNRRTAYFSNATANERLNVSVEAWIENPFITGEDPEIAPIRLLLNYRMERESDERLMLISSAKKVVLSRTVSDTGLCKSLQLTGDRVR